MIGRAGGGTPVFLASVATDAVASHANRLLRGAELSFRGIGLVIDGFQLFRWGGGATTTLVSAGCQPPNSKPL